MIALLFFLRRLLYRSTNEYLYGVRVFAMVHVAHVLVLIATAAVLTSAINNDGYPNNIRGPIRGWRSWNAVNDDVTQNFISAQVRRLQLLFRKQA